MAGLQVTRWLEVGTAQGAAAAAKISSADGGRGGLVLGRGDAGQSAGGFICRAHSWWGVAANLQGEGFPISHRYVKRTPR